jgi:hypothetical protein
MFSGLLNCKTAHFHNSAFQRGIPGTISPSQIHVKAQRNRLRRQHPHPIPERILTGWYQGPLCHEQTWQCLLLVLL